MNKRYRPYDLEQRLLLPPDMRDWLPEGHLALYMPEWTDAILRAARPRTR